MHTIIDADLDDDHVVLLEDDVDIVEEEEEDVVDESCSVDCEVPAWQCRLGPASSHSQELRLRSSSSSLSVSQTVTSHLSEPQ